MASTESTPPGALIEQRGDPVHFRCYTGTKDSGNVSPYEFLRRFELIDKPPYD